ncbi:SMI1/KNR4 family protein [Paenibacillus rhizovicinus]|uniref:SMI1/KNR4 family protein n=1 Tax=Paenibacillus rhizovicinus TaxID=2704463 RepID=A0A6C0P2L9_9BACL|nr:SMI1/KNR4 family protein [Paenibacillus rhizovicinus]QHW32810.1 SMI1/KNR4 family protein [Paenibacillus rhizovicinus]
MSMEELIARIRMTPDCIVLPPSGLPATDEHLRLPEDVRTFYALCGGVTLYQFADYSVNIVPPEEFEPANPVIVGERCEDDISAQWYIAADDGNGDYFTIDLAPERCGKCYDSFHETHGLVGNTPVIARSFTELLERLLANKGQYWYWLDEGFEPLGDAYEE